MSTQPFDRRFFLSSCSVLAGAALLRPTAAMADEPQAQISFPQQDPDKVRRMVGVSHGQLDAVRELLAEDPELAKASWDWGFGDWESALGAASHTGAREIAMLLLEHGARMNLFTAAMLGELTVVRAMIGAQPGIQRTAGPHSLTLMHHARSGGEEAQAVVEYLESVGDADLSPQPMVLTESDKAQLLGTYLVAESDAPITIETHEQRGGLWLRYGDGSVRQLYVTNVENTFHPAGAATVHVKFDRNSNGSASRLLIRWAGGRRISATRAS